MAADLVLVLLAGAGTLLMRASMVTLLADVALPTRVEEALSLVAPAVLAGLVAQTLFLDDGAIRAFDTWYLAGAIAALVAWRTTSFGWTLAAGMISVWILEALL